MQKIKEFLENNLGFDKYSMFKLKSSSAIIIRIDKGSKIGKPVVVLAIKNTNILVNYLIPYLENMRFITKKGAPKIFMILKLYAQLCIMELIEERK